MKAEVEPARVATSWSVDGLAALAGRLPLGVRPRRRGHVAVLDQRRHRPVHGVRRRRPDPAGLRGRAAGALARRIGRGVGPRGPPADRAGRRAGDHQADAVDAAVPVERSRRRAPTSPSTRTRGSGAMATGSRSPTAAPRSSPAARTRRSTAAGCGWGRPRSTARCWRSTRWSTRWWWTSARCRCSWSCARAPSSTTSSSSASACACARTARRAVPDEVIQVQGAAHALGQGARAAGQAHPPGDGTAEGGQRDLAAEPGSARLLRQLGAEPFRRALMRARAGGCPRASCPAVARAGDLGGADGVARLAMLAMSSGLRWMKGILMAARAAVRRW